MDTPLHGISMELLSRHIGVVLSHSKREEGTCTWDSEVKRDSLKCPKLSAKKQINVPHLLSTTGSPLSALTSTTTMPFYLSANYLPCNLHLDPALDRSSDVKQIIQCVFVAPLNSNDNL